MPSAVTTFDVTKHHIHVEFFVTDVIGVSRAVSGVIDTGAPRTEFSDRFLYYAGFLDQPLDAVTMHPGLQTKKYSKIILPKLQICRQQIYNLEVVISRFDEAWGIDALIGLDFFRLFRTTIDYGLGQIITESYQ